jgi:hypothetical protein
MDRSDRELFERSVRHACDEHSGVALDAALDQLGWHEALAVDPRAAVSTLFEAQGATNSTSSALDAVFRSTLGVPSDADTVVVLPALGEWQVPASIVDGESSIRSLRGLALSPPSNKVTGVVVAPLGNGEQVVEVNMDDLTLRPVEGIDPTFGLVEVTGQGLPFGTHRELATGDWPGAITLARLALSHQLVGCARAMLDEARVHALERIQFGQPIAKFQAIRHRLADTLVAVEAADAGLGAAWDEGSPEAAALAKALAGRGARTATRHCQQVLAGIGFTTEHDFHRFVRRAFVLDQLLGASRTVTREFGEQLLATRTLPELPPL